MVLRGGKHALRRRLRLRCQPWRGVALLPPAAGPVTVSPRTAADAAEADVPATADAAASAPAIAATGGTAAVLETEGPVARTPTAAAAAADAAEAAAVQQAHRVPVRGLQLDDRVRVPGQRGQRHPRLRAPRRLVGLPLLLWRAVHRLDVGRTQLR